MVSCECCYPCSLRADVGGVVNLLFALEWGIICFVFFPSRRRGNRIYVLVVCSFGCCYACSLRADMGNCKCQCNRMVTLLFAQTWARVVTFSSRWREAPIVLFLLSGRRPFVDSIFLVHMQCVSSSDLFSFPPAEHPKCDHPQ